MALFHVNRILSPLPQPEPRRLGDAGTQLRETTADFFALGRANPALASGLFRVLLKVFLSSSHSNQGITILLVFLHSPHPCNSGGNITWKTGSKYGQSLHLFHGRPPLSGGLFGDSAYIHSHLCFSTFQTNLIHGCGGLYNIFITPLR